MISTIQTDASTKQEPVDIRAIRRDETDAMLALMCRSFSLDPENAKRIYYSDPFFRLDMKRVLVGIDSGALISCMTLVPTSIRLNPYQTLPICGIAGVCTQPALRCRGYGRELIQQTLGDTADELGYSITALTADRPDYYERLGWAVCGLGCEWSAGSSNLPRCAEAEHVRELRANELEQRNGAIHKLYDIARGNTEPGAFVRDQRRWRCIEKLDSARRVAVYERDGAVTGYAAFDIRIVDGARVAFIREIVGRDAAARRGLLGFFSSSNLTETVTGRCSQRDAEALGLAAMPGMSLDMRPNVYMRAIHISRLVRAILERVAPTPELTRLSGGLSVMVEPEDGDLRSRNGKTSCTIRSTGRRIQVSPCADPYACEHWIEGDPGPITQLALGFKTAAALHSESLIRASSVAAVAVCDTFFPKLNPYLAVPDVF